MAVSLYSAAERARMKSDGALISIYGYESGLQTIGHDNHILVECLIKSDVHEVAEQWFYNFRDFERSTRSANVLIEDEEGYFGGFLHFALNRCERMKRGFDPGDVNIYNSPERCDMIHFLLRHDVDVDVRDSLGRAALHYCCFPNEVDQLLDAGADIDARDARGHTPLMHAVKYSMIVEENMNLDLTQHLLRRGADVTLLCHRNTDAEYWARKTGPYGWYDRRCARLLFDVRCAGGWNAYLNARCVDFATLRSLCRRKFLEPPDGLPRIFFHSCPAAIFSNIIRRFVYGAKGEFFKYGLAHLDEDRSRCRSGQDEAYIFFMGFSDEVLYSSEDDGSSSESEA